MAGAPAALAGNLDTSPTRLAPAPHAATAATAETAETAAAAGPHHPIAADAALASIQSIYRGIERYTAMAATPATLTIQGCRTIYASDFAREPLLPLLTMPGGRQLDLSPVFYTDSKRAIMGVHFNLTWRGGAAQAEGAAATGGEQAARRAAAATLAEALAAVGKEHPDWTPIDAATSCRMAASFGGETLSYRSLFLWGPRKDLEPTVYTDNVVAGMHLLDGVQLPVVEDYSDLVQRFGDNGSAERPQATAIQCKVLPLTTMHNAAILASDTAEHKPKPNSDHSASFTLHGQCSTDANCTSSCSPFSTPLCSDQGKLAGLDPLLFHQPTTLLVLAGDQEFNVGAKCQGAWGCAIESCSFGICGGIGLSPKGVGINVTFGTPLWLPTIGDALLCPQPKPVKHKASSVCNCPAGGSCTVVSSCQDAADGEVGYDTCDEALAVIPAPDCGLCGNGICDAGETCSNCPVDCGSCPPACIPDITQQCGSFVDNCGNFDDLGPCPDGETCVANQCQGGNGGCGNNGCLNGNGTPPAAAPQAAASSPASGAKRAQPATRPPS